ncbi:rod shape-determining protein MreC [Pedobacter sp. UBA4863]|uniref:rod shape-determining protein MreC n=1 Tax=Pedobacter sp. UBA4863 TaxID=1947060 RepID=UPI0025E054FE|nr:rod shape-determining protein MreC [Pedobacter sp. UBA4863]
MRNLWIFLSRYNAFFFFIIFFTVGLVLTIRNNAYQRSVTFSSTNEIVGTAYKRLNVIKRYLNLTQVNDSLAAENAQLKTQLLAIASIDSAQISTVKDTVNHQQYALIAAKVIKNSIALTNNIITINKGGKDGIAKDMAVISPIKGVVGFVQNVSENFATIRPLLNQETAISVVLKKDNAFGSLVWGDDNFDYRKAYVKEIPNHYKVKVGDTIITSGSGGFPRGIEVGKVTNTRVSTGDSFMTLEIALFNNFSTLQFVYIVKDKFAEEVKSLQPEIKNER